MESPFYSADKNMNGRDRTMKSKDIGDVLSYEKRLVSELLGIMEQEVEDIIGGNVDSLEESLPRKQAIIDRIAKDRRNNRAYYNLSIRPADAPGLRTLQQELITLWRKVSGLNKISKTLVERRLREIDEQLKPFIQIKENTYTRSGMVANSSSSSTKGGT